MKQSELLSFASKDKDDGDAFKTFSQISAIFEDLERADRNANKKGLECTKKLEEFNAKISALEEKVEERFKPWKKAQEEYFFASPTLQLVEKLYDTTLEAMSDLKGNYIKGIEDALDAYKAYFEESEESHQQLALEFRRIQADRDFYTRVVKLRKLGVDALAEENLSAPSASAALNE